VHFTGKSYDGQPDWTYGGAWVSGIKNAEIDIEQTQALQATVLPIVRHHWASMVSTEQAMKAKKDAEQGSWRSKK